MEAELKMPDLSTTGSEVTLLNWHVSVGEDIKRGQPLVEIETDKATMSVEATATGKVIRLCAEPGTEVGVGEVIAVIEKIGSPVGVQSTAPTSSTSATAAPSGSATGQSPASPARKAKPGSLFAKKKKTGQDAHSPSKSLSLDPSIAIAGKRLQQSKQTIPHFYLQTSANADPISARREGSDKKLAWDAFIVQAVGKALRDFDGMCCQFKGDDLVQVEDRSVGVAVSLDQALYVLPVSDPANRSLEEISEDIRAKVEKLRSGDKDVRKLKPACLTVSNLGVANVEAFAAIINPPESSILAVGKIEPKPVVADNQIVVQKRVTLVLSVDHRLVNGRYAADFLSKIVLELENIK